MLKAYIHVYVKLFTNISKTSNESLKSLLLQTKFEIQGNKLIEMQVGTGFEIMTEREIVNGQMLYVSIAKLVFNPSNAEATFVHSSKAQGYKKY